MYKQILTILLTGLVGIMACSNPDSEPDNRIAPGSQAQGEVLPHERPSRDMTTPAPLAPELAIAEAQRVADENARRRREARGLPEPVVVRHRDDPTVWENIMSDLVGACSPEEIGVRVCLAVGINANQTAVLLESSLPQHMGDLFTVTIGDSEFTGRVSLSPGGVVWTGSEADRMISAMRSGSGAAMGALISPGGQAIVTDADGMEFRVSLRGASTAIDRVLQ